MRITPCQVFLCKHECRHTYGMYMLRQILHCHARCNTSMLSGMQTHSRVQCSPPSSNCVSASQPSGQDLASFSFLAPIRQTQRCRHTHTSSLTNTRTHLHTHSFQRMALIMFVPVILRETITSPHVSVQYSPLCDSTASSQSCRLRDAAKYITPMFFLSNGSVHPNLRKSEITKGIKLGTESRSCTPPEGIMWSFAC